MQKLRRILLGAAIPAAALFAFPAGAQVDMPASVQTAGRDTSAVTQPAEEPLTLTADLDAHILKVQRGDSLLKTYTFASGQDRYPTPTGDFTIRKIVWNPSWHPPPESDWARGKTAKGPGDPGNPMKVVKIFFKEPDYYIHGTDQIESLGSDASHGCLRMAPDDVADLAKLIMARGGQPHDENWFWRIIHLRREEKVVYLNNPVSLSIKG